MKWQLPPFIAFRYITSRREQRFVSFISLTSWLGLILGVAAMVVVLSVMNGFSLDIQTRILKALPHGYLEWAPEDQMAWKNYAELALRSEGVEQATPLISGRILLMQGKQVRAAELEGLPTAAAAHRLELNDSMLTGNLDELNEKGFGLILGYELARQLGIREGDSVQVLLPDLYLSPAGAFTRHKTFRVQGVFYTGAMPDANLALTDMESAARLFRKMDDRGMPIINRLRIRTQDVHQADETMKRLKKLFDQQGKQVSVESWKQSHRALFDAIRMERAVITLLLLSIVSVAAFNIASILAMMVAEKKKDIAILEVMGMKAKGVTSIFIYQGLFISLFGITGGIALGSLIALHMKKINQAIEELLNSGLFGTAQHYYFYYLPSYYRLQDVLFVALAAFFLCIASAFYPAWQASRIDPVLALND